MLSPTALSLSISSILGTEPLPVLSNFSPAFSRGVVRVTCDCCGQVYLASF